MCPNVITIIYFTFWSYFQGSYLHHKELKAAQGIKITAQVMLIPAYFFFVSNFLRTCEVQHKFRFDGTSLTLQCMYFPG